MRDLRYAIGQGGEADEREERGDEAETLGGGGVDELRINNGRQGEQFAQGEEVGVIGEDGRDEQAIGLDEIPLGERRQPEAGREREAGEQNRASLNEFTPIAVAEGEEGHVAGRERRGGERGGVMCVHEGGEGESGEDRPNPKPQILNPKWRISSD